MQAHGDSQTPVAVGDALVIALLPPSWNLRVEDVLVQGAAGQNNSSLSQSAVEFSVDVVSIPDVPSAVGIYVCCLFVGWCVKHARYAVGMLQTMLSFSMCVYMCVS